MKIFTYLKKAYISTHTHTHTILIFLFLLLSNSLFAACPEPAAHFCNVCVDGTLVANTGIINSLLISGTAPSFACNQGALVVDGGVGIQGNLNVCGAITATGGFSVTGPLILIDPTQSTNCTNGALAVPNGGVGIGGNLNVCGTGTFFGPVIVANTGALTGCTGGAPALTVVGDEVVDGNFGVGGNANVCGQMTVGGSRMRLPGEAFSVDGSRSIPGCTGLSPACTGTQKLVVFGDAGIGGDLQVCDDITANNINICGTGNINNLYVPGNANISNLSVTGSINVNNITVSGTGTFNNLVATGNTQLNNVTVNNLTGTNVSVTGTANINNEIVNSITGNNAAFTNLNVTGNTNLNTENVNVLNAGTGNFNTLNANTFNVNNLNVTGPVSISNTTNSTACNNGALVVSGGVGVGGNINVCGTGTLSNLTVTGNAQLNNEIVNSITGGNATFTNLNVTGSMSGPLSYTYAGCTGVVSRTVQTKLNDYWVNVKDFGATGNGSTDDTAAIQAAINCIAPIGGVLFFPAGSYLVTAPLNLTAITQQVKILGSTSGGIFGQGCTIVGQTGGMVFDCTGIGFLQFENIHILANGGSNPSTIGIALQRTSSGSNFPSNNTFMNVSINMHANPTANGGYGSVALYNYGSEIFECFNSYFRGDSPLVITSSPLNASFNSVYTTTNTSNQTSTTEMTFNTCTFEAWNYSAVLQNDATTGTHMREIRFHNCYCHYIGASSPAPAGTYCYTLVGNIIDCSYSGQLENFTQYFNVQQVLQRCTIECNVGTATSGTSPLIALTDVGTNGNGPGLQGCTISLVANPSAGVPLMQLTTTTRQLGVFDCDIYLYGTQYLDFSNGTSGGNRILAYQNTAAPTILQGSGTHGYLAFNQSSTMNFDGNLNLSGTGAYQQAGQFLVGQDVTNNNVAVGAGSFGSPALPKATVTGIDNTAMGVNALADLTSGIGNSAFGFGASQFNTTSAYNTSFGYLAMQQVSAGSSNVAIGQNCMQFAKNVSQNIAIGTFSMNTVIGSGNVALGQSSMIRASGSGNVAIGSFTLQNAANGFDNVVLGANAMANANNCSNNCALGFNALRNGTGAVNNVAIGYQSLLGNTGVGNIAIGLNALTNNTIGSNNIAIGASGGLSLNGAETNNIDIGNNGISGDQGIIRIGTNGSQTGCFIAGIFNATTGAGYAPVFVNSAGQLAAAASSRNYKKDIETLDAQHEKMLKLRPVSFIYKHDAQNNKQFGLIAEEVNEIYPELIVRDEAGEIFTINYMELIPLLLKHIQDLEQRNQELEARDKIHTDHYQEQQMQIKDLYQLVNALMKLSKDSEGIH